MTHRSLAPQALPTQPTLVLSLELTSGPESQRPAMAPASQAVVSWAMMQMISVVLALLCPPQSLKPSPVAQVVQLQVQVS